MPILPRISKNDDLHAIIYLPEWYYKSKYVRWASYYCFTYGSIYLCLLFYNMIMRPEKVIVFDLLIGGLSSEVILSTAAIFDEKRTILEINQIRECYFWDNEFLDRREKRLLHRDVKLATYAHYLLWVFMMCLFVTLVFVPFLPRFLYGGAWPYWGKVAVRYSFYIYFLTGSYMGITHVSYYAYIILHGYFQMHTIVVYLRDEFHKYKKMSLTEKIDSYEYQNTIEGILMRCIKQHQQLTEYGVKTAVMYRRWIIFHFLTAIMCFSIGFYCYIYDPLTDNIMLIFGILQFLVATLLYVTTGQLFSAAYDDFHKELLNVEWYSMNKSNKALYYMFLIFTRKEFGIEILPSLYVTRPLLTSFLKLIYTGITLLSSVQKNK